MKINYKIIIILLICLTFVSLVAEPTQQGFYCNDESIREPFIALEISLIQLLSVCITVPIIAVIITQYMDKTLTQSQRKYSIHENIITFVFGLLVNFLAVMTAKNIFGRLRPHAIHFCNADHYCREGVYDTKYIDAFECVNDKYSAPYLRNVRHSFYSGHASLGVYSGIYLTLYLRSTLRPKSKPIKYVFELICLTIAVISLYPGYSQWKNYWHFGSDVFTGYTIGLLSSFVVFKYFNSCDNNDHKNANNYMPLNKLLVNN